MKYKIYNQDVLEWAEEYNKGKFHAILCDPPYHLTSIVKRFGKKDSAPAKHGTDGVFQRTSTGFMGQEWDGGDIAFQPETWAALAEHLFPGGFGMAFSASRNWHRLAVAIEDAGLIIHPNIFCWLQGQGFPKATRIDKKANDERWAGHRYGLQAMKPSVEPIIVWQKPYEGKPLDNITQTGAGALNIDGARIPLLTESDEYVINTFDDGAKPWGDAKGEKYTSRKIKTGAGKGKIGTTYSWSNTERKGGQWEGSEQGRWPANFALNEEAASRLDAQAGNSGGPSRFFFQVSNNIDEADPVYYCAKASKSEKNVGLENLEDKAFGHSGGARSKLKQGEDEYLQDNMGYNRISHVKNNHPTNKPIDLCTWLATLLLPPEMYAPRRILIPFSGVMSEAIGAMLAGWDQICAVEMSEEYCETGRKRMEYWKNEKA